jgi:predicted PurR-regulated permease PerM
MSAQGARSVDATAEDTAEDRVAAIREPAARLPMREEPARAAREDMPLPTEPRTIFLGGLFLLALLTALYVASPIVLPVVLAIVLKLLLQPFVRLMDRLRVPHSLGAVLAIGLLVAAVATLISGVAGPAAAWAQKLPDAIPRMQQELAFLARPISSLQWMFGQLENMTGGGTGLPQAPAPHLSIMGALFAGTATIATAFFTTLIVLFYLLVSGETFMRRFVEILPSFAEKRQAVELTLDIEHHVSAYLITITLINGVVGLLALCVMWACGVDSPLLWGVIAFVLNFVPILGPVCGVVLFLMAGVLSLGVTWWALLPVGLYFAIHVLEGEIVTPMLLARRFTINPVAVILALIFWYWMWGVPGAILAVPVLAITKIVCDDLRPLRALGHLLEG